MEASEQLCLRISIMSISDVYQQVKWVCIMDSLAQPMKSKTSRWGANQTQNVITRIPRPDKQIWARLANMAINELHHAPRSRTQESKNCIIGSRNQGETRIVLGSLNEPLLIQLIAELEVV